MSFCVNCGAKLADGTKYCPDCGAGQPEAVNTQPERFTENNISGFQPSAETSKEIIIHEYSAPANEYSAPAKEYGTPANEYSTPANEYSAPANEYSAPAKEYGAPAKEYSAPANEYGAPAKEYSAPAKEYSAPAKEYSTPVNEYNATSQTYQAPAAGYPAQTQEKKNSKKIIIIAAVAIAAVAVIAILALTGVFGGKKENSEVYGRYEIVSESAYGSQCSTQGEWVELFKGGKGTYYSGYEYDLEWKLKGTDFSGAVSFFGIENDMTGTLENGVLTVTYGDYTMVFKKDGAGGLSDGSESVYSDAGYYTVYSMENNGMVIDYYGLLAEDMADAYMWLSEDGTGEVKLITGADAMKITWDPGIIHYNGTDLEYVREGNIITLDLTGGTKVSYTLDMSLYGNENINTHPDYDLIGTYEGDWHGLAEFSDCYGKYEKNEGEQMEMVARFSFDGDGNLLVPYIRGSMSSDESDNFSLNDSCYLDSQMGSIMIDGMFCKIPFDDITELYYVEEDNCIRFYIFFDDGTNGFSMTGSLRRLDDDWSGEYYVSVPYGFYDYYEGWTLEEIASQYNVDTALIPEKTNIGGKNN